MSAHPSDAVPRDGLDVQATVSRNLNGAIEGYLGKLITAVVIAAAVFIVEGSGVVSKTETKADTPVAITPRQYRDLVDKMQDLEKKLDTLTSDLEGFKLRTTDKRNDIDRDVQDLDRQLSNLQFQFQTIILNSRGTPIVIQQSPHKAGRTTLNPNQYVEVDPDLINNLD